MKLGIIIFVSIALIVYELILNWNHSRVAFTRGKSFAYIIANFFPITAVMTIMLTCFFLLSRGLF